MGLKLFYDLLSQPSRACYMFLKVNNIPFFPCPIAVQKLAQRSEAFSATNPLMKVPALSEDGFLLSESNAILKYLALQYKAPDHWYPTKSLKQQARIDEYLQWHDFNVRSAGTKFFNSRVIRPLTTGLPVENEKVNAVRAQLIFVAKLFEHYYLGQTPFVSSQEISIADLLALVEFMQPLAGGFDIFAERPALAAWRGRVEPHLQPHFDETHQVLFTIAKRVELSENNQPVV